MQSRYYEDELQYLRSLGAEYATRYPNNAAFLGSDDVDPDVQRLLQGFAFLTARLHERLDSQYSEIAEAFLQILEPSLLRPTPALAMVEFLPDARQIRKSIKLPAGQSLSTVARKSGSCRFQTCQPLTIFPFQIADLKLESGTDSLLRIRFALNSGTNLADSAPLATLPLYLFSTDDRVRYGWFLWLTQYVKEAFFQIGEQRVPVTIRPSAFARDLGLVPEVQNRSSQLLREFLAYPESFLTVEIDSLAPLAGMSITESFELVVNFGRRRLQEPMLSTKKDQVRLNCVPAVNLFRTTARLTLNHRQREYRVRADEYDISQHEVFTVDAVVGTSRRTRARRDYLPFSLRHRPRTTEGTLPASYRVRFSDIQVRYEDKNLIGRECFLSLFPGSDQSGLLSSDEESIQAEITCTNREMAREITQGELRKPTEDLHASLAYRDIGPIIRPRPAPRAEDAYWLLVSSFELNRSTTDRVDHLRKLIELHSPTGSERDAIIDRWQPMVQAITTRPDITVERGCPLRVLDVQLNLDSEAERLAESYLLGGVLCELLRRSATMNSRFRFAMRHDRGGDERWRWGHLSASVSGMAPVL